MDYSTSVSDITTSSLRRFWARLEDSVHPDDKPIFAEYPQHTFNLKFPPPAFVGDVDAAPIVILMSNGGYKPGITEREFPDEASISEYRRIFAARCTRYLRVFRPITQPGASENGFTPARRWS